MSDATAPAPALQSDAATASAAGKKRGGYVRNVRRRWTRAEALDVLKSAHLRSVQHLERVRHKMQKEIGMALRKGRRGLYNRPVIVVSWEGSTERKATWFEVRERRPIVSMLLVVCSLVPS